MSKWVKRAGSWGTSPYVLPAEEEAAEPASWRVKLHFKWAMPRLRVKSLYGPVLPFFPRAARLSGAVGDRFAAGGALRRNAAHRRSCAVISAHRGCQRPCEFAGSAADFPSTGSYVPGTMFPSRGVVDPSRSKFVSHIQLITSSQDQGVCYWHFKPRTWS